MKRNNRPLIEMEIENNDAIGRPSGCLVILVFWSFIAGMGVWYL